jgi:hypothetical protein
MGRGRPQKSSRAGEEFEQRGAASIGLARALVAVRTGATTFMRFSGMQLNAPRLPQKHRGTKQR